MMANRNGFFSVLDRTDGKVLLAKPFIKRLTWASGIGADGRPQLLKEGDVTCPETATNWNATAFSPKIRLYYVVALEKCAPNPRREDWKEKPPMTYTVGDKQLVAIAIGPNILCFGLPTGSEAK